MVGAMNMDMMTTTTKTTVTVLRETRKGSWQFIQLVDNGVTFDHVVVSIGDRDRFGSRVAAQNAALHSGLVYKLSVARRYSR